MKGGCCRLFDCLLQLSKAKKGKKKDKKEQKGVSRSIPFSWCHVKPSAVMGRQTMKMQKNSCHIVPANLTQDVACIVSLLDEAWIVTVVVLPEFWIGYWLKVKFWNYPIPTNGEVCMDQNIFWNFRIQITNFTCEKI